MDFRAERERLKEQIKAELRAARDAQQQARRRTQSAAADRALAELEALLPPEHPLARHNTPASPVPNPAATQNLLAPSEPGELAPPHPSDAYHALSLDAEIDPEPDYRADDLPHTPPAPKTLGPYASPPPAAL